MNRGSPGSNLAYVSGRANDKLGNVTNVEGNKITIVLSGKEHTSFLKHHFHHDVEEEESGN